MASSKTWLEPTSRFCPNGHPVWHCKEVMELAIMAVERRGPACRTCDWQDLPPFGEGTFSNWVEPNRYGRDVRYPRAFGADAS